MVLSSIMMTLRSCHLWNNASGGTTLPTVYTVAVTDAIATINGQGEQWAIALVNHHPSETVACRRKPGNMPLQGTFSAKVLAGDSPDAFSGSILPEGIRRSAAPFTDDPSSGAEVGS